MIEDSDLQVSASGLSVVTIVIIVEKEVAIIVPYWARNDPDGGIGPALVQLDDLVPIESQKGHEELGHPRLGQPGMWGTCACIGNRSGRGDRGGVPAWAAVLAGPLTSAQTPASGDHGEVPAVPKTYGNGI